MKDCDGCRYLKFESDTNCWVCTRKPIECQTEEKEFKEVA